MKLNTIQKINKLNNVITLGKKENGGAYHDYSITYKDEDGTYQTPISFQKGGRNTEGSKSGVIDTDLLEIVRHRLQCFQQGEFATRENAIALTHIEEALMWLNRRVEERAERNVLGKNEK